MNNLKYFSSFHGYSMPLIPIGELEFERTASVPTFYVGRFGESGELVHFLKIAVTRRESRSFVLPEQTEPGTVFYFSVNDRSAEPIVWDPLPYHATEHLREYYEGRVDDTGLGGTATRFERQVAFAQTYDADRLDSSRFAQALLIGSDESLEPQLPPGDSAVLDTRLIASALAKSRRARFDSIAALENSRTDEITDQIRDSVSSTTSDGVLFMYFSGNSLIAGDGDVLLTTRGATLDDIHNTSISMRMLAKELAACKGKVLIVLDCWESGETTEQEELRAIDTFKSLHQSDRVAVIASRRLIENSMDSLSIPLARGLLGHADMDQDGKISTTELCSYVHHNLRRTSSSFCFVAYADIRWSKASLTEVDPENE